jgi:hypothetical protein
MLTVEGLELAAAKPGVHRGRPDCAIALRDGGDQSLSLIGRSDAVAPRARSSELEPIAGIDCELATADGTAEHRPDREHGATHRRRVQSVCRQLIGDGLEIRATDVRQARTAHLGEDAESHRPWCDRAIIRRAMQRAGKVAALVSLERALRPEGPGQEDIDAELDQILGKGEGS